MLSADQNGFGVLMTVRKSLLQAVAAPLAGWLAGQLSSRRGLYIQYNE